LQEGLRPDERAAGEVHSITSTSDVRCQDSGFRIQDSGFRIQTSVTCNLRPAARQVSSSKLQASGRL
jgi:hypothetical protein